MKLIVGLGNPGSFYSRNRHNIGFMCLNYLAKKHGIRLDKKQGLARTGAGDLDGNEVVLARPQTFMNSSGESVARLVGKLNVSPPDLIVIHDDLDLPPGRMRIRMGSSSGGHKGINSIINNIGSRDFYRIKVGIGRPQACEGSAVDKEAAVVAYVLSDFTPEEVPTINRVIDNVSQAVVCLLNEGLEAAMNKFN